MKTILAALILVAGGLFASPSHALQLTADLTGQVVDADKQPIVGALVVIENIETGRVIVKRTNSRGRYNALGLRPDGVFRLTVHANNHVVSFKPGEVKLGHRMRRNVVLGADPGNPPAFMRAWYWNQDGIVDFQG